MNLVEIFLHTYNINFKMQKNSTLFGLGTIPLMTSAIYLGKFLNTTLKHRIQKAIPIFVVVIGLLFIIRGLGLGIFYLSLVPIIDMASNTIDCH